MTIYNINGVLMTKRAYQWLLAELTKSATKQTLAVTAIITVAVLATNIAAGLLITVFALPVMYHNLTCKARQLINQMEEVTPNDHHHAI